MEIRTRITLQFMLIVAVIQLLLSVAIYLSFAKSRIDDIYARLEAKATSVGQMLVDIDEIDAEVLKKIERNNPMSLPDEKVIIYDHKDSILFTNDEKRDIRIDSEMIKRVRVNTRAWGVIGHYEVLGMFYTSPRDRVVVFVAAIDVEGFRKLSILRFILVFVFIIGMVLVYFAGRVFAGRAVYPIMKVMEQVDRIGISNLNARLDEGNGKDEIAHLAATFNKLLQRLESSFKMQKNFIANASHELNTPLTVITGQLEVALIKARTNEEYAEAISSALSEIRNLNQLSGRLLIWAQASSELTGANFTQLRIDDLLWQIRSEFLTRFPAYSVKIGMDQSLDDQDHLTVKGNELLLKTAIANIVENGCKYSVDQRVEVLLSNESNYLVMHFIDHGTGIPESEVSMIFQPFYRGHLTKRIAGHGIGLSLAEEVVALHRGSIVVTSRLNEGSDFTVRLPLANPPG